MPALSRCVGDPDAFLAEIFGRRVKLHRGQRYDDLLSLPAVDHMLATMALRLPAFRLVKNGATLPTREYVKSARLGSRPINDLIDPGRVYRHFEQGATIVLQGLHRYWPPIIDFCQDLERRLTHPVQANAYITPPTSQGLNVHHDGHDVFAIHVHGRKQWVVYDQDKTADGGGAVEQERLGEPALDVVCSGGDCLYMPQGTPHAARTVDQPSIHLTVGVRVTRWAGVLRPLVDGALAEAAFADRLPAGYADDPAALRGRLADRLRLLAKQVDQLDAGEAANAAVERFWSKRSPVLAGQLGQLLSLDEIDDDTTVRRRAHVGARLQADDGHVLLQLGDRRLRMPARVEPAARWVVEHERFRVAQLGPFLDEPSRKTFVRRLIREGLLERVRGE